MWCETCQQDVPAIAMAGDEAKPSQYCCARCNQLFTNHSDDLNHEPSAADRFANTPQTSSQPPVDVDSWDLELDVLGAEHMLLASTSTRPLQHAPLPDLTADWHLGGQLAQTPAANAEAKPETQHKKPRTSLIAWMLILCGMMAFACGAVLMGLSLAQARGELWRMGLPLALVGQCGLIVGLVLQLERYWQSHRRANDRLHEVDSQVSDLQMTTDLLGSTHSGPSQAFYHHMAGGANTELLLADLKGQMDMLAAQMARSGRR